MPQYANAEALKSYSMRIYTWPYNEFYKDLNSPEFHSGEWNNQEMTSRLQLINSAIKYYLK